MIRLGICTDMKNAPKVAAIGYDYLEPSLTAVARMSEEEFTQAADLIASTAISCEAMNGMLPGDLAVTGPAVDPTQMEEYLSSAFFRAAGLGAKVIVFGSGNARRVPDGFSHTQAWRQLQEYLCIADRHAQKHGLQIAIEPLRREECNILHYVSEATLLASLTRLPCIGVLGDTYHMYAGNEPLSALAQAGDLLYHIHTASLPNRTYPGPADRQDCNALLQTLIRAGYNGRISVEANTQDFEADAQASFTLLNDLRQTLNPS